LRRRGTELLELRQLHYFVAVAEAEHVGRAATALNMSQSPLSRQIHQLEAQLGVALFERERKRLWLTKDGRAFLAEARSLIAQGERLERYGASLAAGQDGRLVIGYVEGAVHAGLLARALAPLRADRPRLELRLLNHRSYEQLRALRSREIDVGFLYTPPETADPDLHVREILNELLLLALPAGDPLAGRARIAPADLDGKDWITVSRAPTDTTRDQFVAAATRAGFNPHVVCETAYPLTSLGLVGAGIGLAVVQASLKPLAPEGVELREIPWFDRSVRVHLAWRRADQRASVAALVAAVIRDGKGAR